MSKITLSITVKDSSQMVATSTKHEKYSLILRDSKKWSLDADYYVGFLRGLETFTQLFENKENDINEAESFISGIPIIIDDEPDFFWRGIMIDSSRHFHSMEVLKKMVDGLLYNKMNVLHWHIVDEDSFPLEIEEIPELAQYGQIAGTYSQNDVKSLIQYAKTRGVRLIPEIDTPGHTQSWGRSDKLK